MSMRIEHTLTFNMLTNFTILVLLFWLLSWGRVVGLEVGPERKWYRT